MGKITMPPSGVDNKVFDYCLEFTDVLEIEFKDEGFLWSTPDGIFNPDLPKGLVTAGSDGTYKPISNNTSSLIVFGDISNKKLYEVQVSIQTKCPSDKK